MTLKEKADVSKNIIELSMRTYPRFFVSCSFGKDSRVLVDLATSVKPDVQVIGIDTGYEFPETLTFGNSLARSRGLNFRWVSPTGDERRAIDQQYGDSFVVEGQYKCCEMKIPAINGLLSEYDAWVTGLRRDETEYRKNIGIIEYGKIVKVNPIAFWTKDEIWEYIKGHKLDYHPLYDKGYQSLGCEPCTTEGRVQSGGGRQGQFERAGRFTMGDVGGECGLHVEI